MAGWYERAVETWFKPTADGYEFRCPRAWLFGTWRSYLVNQVQKESLATYLRQRQRLMLRLMAVYLLVGLGLSALFGYASDTSNLSAAAFGGIVFVALLGMLAFVLVPHLYLMRKIEPILKQLKRTDSGGSLGEQIFEVAAVISNVNVALGGLGGVLIAAANIKTIAEELSAGRADSQLLWSGTGLLIGLLMAAYFLYLAILKRRLKRKPN